MEKSFLVELSILLALVLANGILAGSEIAVVAMRPSRMRELAAAGSRSARALERLRRVPERFLSTIQVGITVIGATAGAFGGATFAAHLQRELARIPPLEPHAREVSLVLVVMLISYLSVVLGELVPKSMALRAPDRYALLIAGPLELLSWIARPIVTVLTASSNAVLRLFGDRTSFTETKLSREELRSLVDEASQGGSVDADAGEIATRALDLGELTAADVMVHRRFVVALPVDASADEVREAFLGRGHQRIPVYEGSIDNAIGYLSWRDVVPRLLQGGPLDLRSILRPCHFVPETTAAPALLEEMRSRRLHLAIAVDEHGGTAGIVTLEDLLEELVGEITSEHDTAPESILREDGGAAVAQGSTPLREINRELGLDLEEPSRGTTLGGLCIELAEGRIPRAGERFRTRDGTELEILEASARRVRSVRIRPRGAGSELSAGERPATLSP